MSDYLDAPVHDAVNDEARATWAVERPEGDRPSAAELEADDFADWCWWRDQGVDPWGDLAAAHTPTPRDWSIPTEPPF